ncbi:hypothetical protein FRB99_000284 [Tulasnella sp. 403]|nr:hypothetical protein FRB99_000284 [Tulasnella sp. 403]
MFRLSFLLLTLIVPALSAIPTTPDSIKAIRHGSRYRETSAGRLSKDLPPLKPKMPNAFTKSIGPWASPLPPVPPGEGYTGTIAFLTASNESITVPAFGQITAEYENYEYSQTYYSLVITSMTGVRRPSSSVRPVRVTWLVFIHQGLFTKGDRLGLQQTGVNYDFLAGPGYLELRPVIRTLSQHRLVCCIHTD